MNKLAAAFVAASIIAVSLPALAMEMDMKAMDMNGDGMISKDEFMKYHEAMYDKMKKGSNGMVSMKDMQMMSAHDGMMKDGKPMMKGDSMMKDGTMMKDKVTK